LGNPTVRVLEKILAELENGEDAKAYASGMAAIFNIVTSLASKDDHIITSDCIYGGTHSLFFNILPKFGIEITPVDLVDPIKIKGKIKKIQN
jgi:methionine-gamma-lyase